MASSSTFAMEWNPRRHQSDPLHDLDLRPHTRSSKTGSAFTALPQVNLDLLVRAWVLQFTNIFTDCLAHVVALSPPRDGITTPAERGKTHLFNVLVVSFMRGSARLWPGDW